ncbi:MAG TPA: alpha/beta fold hydrolase [Candidatus Acidoferrales bacterium]|jgi:esterase/lipase|nr:alpha/beta fold hydrolase [Candidatus Acidoferrales bacterium]
MLALPDSRPAATYEDALERVRAFKALDDASILPEAQTALYDCGKRTPLAVVLFHGYTNNPAQFSKFAPMLQERGVNVLVPRMPEHGDKDRMSRRLEKLTAESLIASANEAVDIACGLGERVGVLGISMGGSLSAYFAQHRTIAISVPVAPEFALLQMPYGLSRTIAWIVRHVPNFFLWWDPRLKASLQPKTAYPRFSTHALAQTLRVGDDVYKAAEKGKQLAERIVPVVNRCDPAVNNDVTKEVATNWAGWNRNGVEYVEMRNLAEWHDIIEWRNPKAHIDIVYPRLLQALGVA